MLYKLFKVFAIVAILFTSACGSNGDSLKNDKISLGYTKAYVIGQNYLDSVNLFRNIGFEDIIVYRLEGPEYENFRHGEVIDVTIGGLEDFNEDTKMSKSDRVSITYVSNKNKAVAAMQNKENSLAGDFDLFKASDHLLFNDSNDLGWEETWTITIEATPNNLNWDDFTYTYDADILDIKAKSMHYDSDKSYLAFELSSKKEGLTKIKVCAFVEDGQECHEFNVNALNEVDGRKVYLVPNNDVYHYTEECPGEDVIATTYHFVESKGIKACDKCESNLQNATSETNDEIKDLESK